jgi:diguanylate cyclase (GGDEF)-like protein/PAS domain S-box-containing protein
MSPHDRQRDGAAIRQQRRRLVHDSLNTGMPRALTFTTRQRSVLLGTGASCVVLGLLVLIGWHTQHPPLIQLRPGLSPMNYNTALAVLCGGLGLLALAVGRYRGVLISALWPTIAGALTLTQYLLGINVGVDEFLHESSVNFGAQYPGRMGFNAALCVCFVGCAFVMLSRPATFRWRPMMLGALGLITVGITLSVLFSYVTAMAVGVLWDATTAMGIHTAVTLGLLGAMVIVAAWRDFVTRTPDPAQLLRAGRTAWIVMGLSVVATGVAWWVATDSVTGRARARFDETVQQARSAIINRMQDYEQILIGGRGLFAASRSVDRATWRAFVESLEVADRFPGIQGVGFASYLHHRDKPRYETSVRHEGFADFRINPEGERNEYAVTTYIEPFVDMNFLALGADMYAEPVRREAMERARDTGLPAMSGRVRLDERSTLDSPAGFFLYVPVYRNGMPRATVEERRAALVGFSYGTFRIDDLMNGVLGTTAREIRFEIFDGTSTARNSILYGDEFDRDMLPYRPTFEKTITDEIGGRMWTFVFSTWPSFDAAVTHHEPVIVLAGGLVVSLLLFGITWSLTTTRERALALAERMTDTLRKTQAQFRAVTDHANDAIVSTDAQGIIMMWNRSAGHIFGYGKAEILGKPLTDLLADRSRSAHDKTLKWVAESGERGVIGQSVELVGRRKDGREFSLELSLSTWTQGEQRYYTGIMRDVTERKRTTERLAYLATHDALTGLPNRALYADRLEQALARPAWNNRLVAVMFLDLDRFKAINDTLGHDAGDLLIQTVATRLTAAVREGDTVARQGGDEFTIVLIDMARLDDVALVAQKILTAMAEPFNLHGTQVPVTFSIGIACYPVDGTDAATLLKHADTALYRAKQRGRNTFQLFSAA